MTSDQDTNPDAELSSGEESLDRPGISLQSSAARPQANRNFSASATFPGRKERPLNRDIDPLIRSTPHQNADKKLKADNKSDGEQIPAEETRALPEQTPPRELNDLVGDKSPAWAAMTTPRPTTDRSVLIAVCTAALAVVAMLFGGYAVFQLSGELDAIKEELTSVKLASSATSTTSDDIQNTRNEETAERVRALEVKVGALAMPPGPDSGSLDVAIEDLTQRISKLETTVDQDIEKAERQKLAQRLNKLESNVASVSANTEVRQRLDRLEQATVVNNTSKIYNSEPRQNLSTAPASDAQQPYGNWSINVGTFSDRRSAEKLLAKVQGIVERAEIQTITADNRSLYRIRAIGYRSRRAAELQAQSLQAAIGLSGLWIDQRE